MTFKLCVTWQVMLMVIFVLTICGCGGGGGSGSGGGGAVNTKPLANAGRDLKVLKNALVILDGSASSDADGNSLTYIWTVASKPLLSSATLSSPSSVAPLFTTDIPGIYAIGLVVSDGCVSSNTDTVSITVLDSVSNIHDTGYNKCYNASNEIACPSIGDPFYGQDAHYSTNPMQFVDEGTTVTDNLTGLMWQKTDSSTKYNWYKAMGVSDVTYNPSSINVCGSLNLGGHTDWRLPSRRELVSILNYAQQAPDQTYFQGGGTYWTSTKMGSPSATNVWIVQGYLVDGALRFPGGLTAPYDVKCVRGTAWGQSNNYINNGDGTVTDSMSDLRWQQHDDGVARSWEEALFYCENSLLAGFTDWRLPDIKELESIVYIPSADFSLPLNSAYFTHSTENTGLSFYWSSTTYAASTGAALGVDFYNGSVDYGGFSKGFSKFARCVR